MPWLLCACTLKVDSLHGMISRTSYLISAGLPYLSIVEFILLMSGLSSSVSVHIIWWSIIENILYDTQIKDSNEQKQQMYTN